MNKKEKTEKPKEAKVAKSSPNAVASLEEAKVAEAICADKDCPKHGNLKARGRVFDGKVIKKFHKRVVIEFERMIYVRKYERYTKAKTKLHVRLPVCMEKEINLGDLIKVQECRPLSKIIHFVVIKKIKDAEEVK